MKSYKGLLLIGAIAAVAVLAIPATASASVWKDKGVNLSKFAELGLSGGEVFETSKGNGMSCKVHAKMTTEGGSSAEITEYKTLSCPKELSFGTFAGCELNTAVAEGLPWEVTVNASDLTISKWHTKRTFKNCGTTELNKTIGSVTVTLLSPTAITEMEFLGEITGYKAFGSWSVEGTNSGTYGIG